MLECVSMWEWRMLECDCCTIFFSFLLYFLALEDKTSYKYFEYLMSRNTQIKNNACCKNLIKLKTLNFH